MKAFVNTHHDKQFFVNRLRAHMDADELITETGWDGTSGCSVGCILHEYAHAKFEPELGLPEWFARLVDFLHENVSGEYRKTFSMNWLLAVEPGADVDVIRVPFLIRMQERSLTRLGGTAPDVTSAIKQVIAALRTGGGLEAARFAAWSAANAAEAAARSAAWSAAESAESAANAAEAAARSAESAARFAAESAESAARFAEAEAQADDLIELLNGW